MNPVCEAQSCGDPVWGCVTQSYFYSMQLSHSDIVRRLASISPHTKVISRYIGSVQPLQCQCNQCGNTWSTTWNSLKYGHGCPQCGRQMAANKNRTSIEEIKRRLHKINQSLQVIGGNYKNVYSELKFLCTKCNNSWVGTWNSLRDNVTGCRKCSYQKLRELHSFSLVEVQSRLCVVSPTITVQGEYTNNKSKLTCVCNICGNQWYSNWADLSQRHGCPKCCSGNSEEEVRKILQDITGLEWPRATPTDVPFLHGLTLDCYCKELKSDKFHNGTAVERQGEQHYRLVNFGGKRDTRFDLDKRRRNDHRKRIQCWRHQIRLIRLPYWIRDTRSYLSKRLCNV